MPIPGKDPIAGLGVFPATISGSPEEADDLSVGMFNWVEK